MEVEFILYVRDQQASRDFYSTILDKEPSLDVPGMTEFLLTDTIKLGIMPETGINKILAGKTPTPMSGNGIPRCELYLKLGSITDICARASKAGAAIVSASAPRDWGDTVAYFSDPDGHIIAFAQTT
jgi:lactoylglutathione lyase